MNPPTVPYRIFPARTALLAVLLIQSGLVQASPDLSRWACRFCPAESTQTDGAVELGAGHASEELLRFAPGPGGPVSLDESGAFAWLGGHWDWRHLDGRHLRGSVERLGLDNPQLRLEAGHQGRYVLSLGYQELPQRAEPAGQSPFLSMSASRLELPPGWTAAGTTAGMAQLRSSLRPVQFAQDRRWLDLDGHFQLSRRWSTSLDFRHERREGTQLRYGSFLTQTGALPAPVDFVTDTLEWGTQFAMQNWLARLDYSGSVFRNQSGSLSWQNPYLPLSPGAERGQLAGAPDNLAHQLSLSGQYFGIHQLQVSGHFSAGRMTQDESLLPATLNPQLLAAAPLPRRSAQARVDTQSAQLRAAYRASPRLRLQAQYRWRERDNQTPQDAFTQVRTDVFVSALRRNLPYAYRDATLTLRGDYRATRQLRLRLGFEQQDRQRRFQARRNSQEDRIYGQARFGRDAALNLTARVGFSRRDGSAFEELAAIRPAENPHLRAFNLADREGREASLGVSAAPGGRIQLGLQASLSDDRYRNSEVGLERSERLGTSLNLSSLAESGPSLHFYLSHSEARLQQAGSSRFALANWWATSRDVIQAAGLSLEQADVLPRLDLKAGYDFSATTGRIQVSRSDYPELSTRLHSAQLDATYRWRPGLNWLLRYRYERYADDDAQREALAPDALPGLLAPGQLEFDGVNHVLSLSARYRFD